MESFTEFWCEAVLSGALDSLDLPIIGLTAVSPHKEAALLIAETVSQVARRAIAAVLVQSGAGVTWSMVTQSVVNHAARLLRLPYVPLPGVKTEGYDILVNATLVGRDDDETSFEVEKFDEAVVVIDLAYGSRLTPLVANALTHEWAVIDDRLVADQVIYQD